MRERLRRIPKFSLVGGMGAGMALLVFAYSLSGLRDVAAENCREIEGVKTEIRAVVGHSLQTLGKPGTAGYRYYVTHPDELAQARDGLKQELAQFAARRC